MKIGLGRKMALSARCAKVSRTTARADCGLAIAEHLLRSEAVKSKAGLSPDLVAAGIHGAVGVEFWALGRLPKASEEPAKRIIGQAERLSKRITEMKVIREKDVPALLNRIHKVKETLNLIWDGIETECKVYKKGKK